MTYPILKQMGDSVTISATIKNTGNADRTVDIHGQLDPVDGTYGQSFDFKRVSIPPGFQTTYNGSRMIGDDIENPWDGLKYKASIHVEEVGNGGYWMWTSNPEIVIEIASFVEFTILDPIINGG